MRHEYENDNPSAEGHPVPRDPITVSLGDEANGLRSRRSIVTVAVVGAVVLVAAIFVVPHLFGGGSTSDPPGLATAAISSFPVTDSATGTVVPESEIPINFGTSGQLQEIDVQVGQQVKQGTVIAKLEDATPESDLSKADAAVASANAALGAAEDPLNPGHAAQLESAVTSAEEIYNQVDTSVQTRANEDAAVVSAAKTQLNLDEERLSADACSPETPSNALVCQGDQQAISQDQSQVEETETRAAADASEGQVQITSAQAAVTSAQSAIAASQTSDPSQVAAAQAQVSSADAELQEAQTEVADVTLVAPTSGTVLEINGEVGENVTGGATNEPSLPGTETPIPTSVDGTPTANAGVVAFAVIGSTSRNVVGVPFPASDAQQVAELQTGTMSSSTGVGASVPCHVLAVAPEATTFNGASVVWATVVPDTSASQLTSGLTVNVTIQVSQANSVLAVPVSSVYLLGGVPHVDVWTGKHAVPTVVTTGLQGTSLIAITSGLNSGEQVVVSAYQGLPGTGSTGQGAP
jgi:multidrug efflux pump subunit AcrA (membrane-fusion protein)